MKKNIIIIGCVLLSIIIISGLTALALTDTDNTDKAEYPNINIGKIVGDNTYPAPLDVAASENAVEKKWYEYITYSGDAVTIYSIDDNTRVVFYDPYDYTYGMIVEISDTVYLPEDIVSLGLGSDGLKSYINSSGSISDGFSTANSKTVAYTKSIAKTEGQSNTVSGEIELGGEWGRLSAKIKGAYGHTWDHSNSTSISVAISETYNAVMLNKEGAPYSWKIVHYTAWLPIKCVIERKDSSNNWISSSNNVYYYLLATIQGSCREYSMNGDFYIEDWTNSELVLAENGWGGFLTQEKLIDSYNEKILPKN